MRTIRVGSTLALILLACAAPLAAQRFSDSDDGRWLENCRSGWNGNDDRGRACEERRVPVKLSGRILEIDGRENGGIKVVGWDRDSVQVTARLQANARSDGAASDLLKEVRITSDGRRITADGARSSSRGENWSVSYLIYVPRRFDLRLDAHNGGVGVTGVTGRLELSTENGSVNLSEVGGDVRARTQNGSVNVELAGSKWDGRGLDAETQNGSVRMGIPASYAATIETGTVNGRMSTDFPITLTGRIGRRMTLPLNGGGTPIRVETTNGSVSLTRR
ncbi:MAG: DUF4097 family beta strand repeat-containing protein [bacterium]